MNTRRCNPHARLIARKNSAYAWRQMIFFLSRAPSDDGPSFVTWAAVHLADRAPPFIHRFSPVLAGLADAIGGTTAPSRLFLGWSTAGEPL